jgi:hypothetical protein
MEFHPTLNLFCGFRRHDEVPPVSGRWRMQDQKGGRDRLHRTLFTASRNGGAILISKGFEDKP